MCWGSTTKAVLHIYYRVENMVILYAGARYRYEYLLAVYE